MPNKSENVRATYIDTKVTPALPAAGCVKSPVIALKPGVNKVVPKEAIMSPGALQQDEERTELLGSLTTQQQQRTSARVIKKLRLEPQTDKRDVIECETPNKIDEKDPLKFPTVKQRMPKALWSADEKSLFFEALNEYGKDFDAITSYICVKMKKKGMLDGNLKTKTQVSHFYYRTWHKLSKHVHFDEDVKKVAQELYALINYGELRRKLVSVNEKICARLGEMVRGGSIAVRTKGKTIRVRTPMCRALRRLNQITGIQTFQIFHSLKDCAYGARVCARAHVSLRARDAGAWSRVQAAAHNPRAEVALALRTRLSGLLRALERRWKSTNHKAFMANGIDVKTDNKTDEYTPRLCKNGDNLEGHLNLETDRTIIRERASLHAGPRAEAEVRLPALRPRAPLASQKISFASYLERMGALRGQDVKIRTPKRHRKDSLSEKDKDGDKKIKIDDLDAHKLMHIDETAIDGIELMAHYKHHQEDEEKPSTEDEKELRSEETAEEEGDRDITERDKDMSEREKDISERDKDMSEREKDSFSEMEDDEKYNKSDTDNESDGRDKRKERKFKNLKVKFRIRPKKRGGSVYTLVVEDDKDDKHKEDELKVDEKEDKDEELKPDIDVDLAMRQIRKGWSVYDAGDLTIGDLYLMFGARSRLELDYWWAEPTPPLPQIRTQKPETNKPETDKLVDKREKGNKTPEKGDSSVEDEREKRESDTDIFSPKNTFSQDSNDGMSGDERKSEQLSSPDHKSGTLNLASKLINRPTTTHTHNGFSLVSDRLRRLLALAGNPQCGRGGCGAGRRQVQKPPACSAPGPASPPAAAGAPVFRHPTPIAPKPDTEFHTGMSLEGLPKWRRGRPPNDRRVVVQRLLPLMPKLPTPNNLIPVKMVSNSQPVQPRLVPKPPPASTSDLSMYYVLSESNGQFFFHDGDRRVPITVRPEPATHDAEGLKTDEEDSKDTKNINIVKIESVAETSADKEPNNEITPKTEIAPKTEQNDISSFLPSDSLSLSPSRLLRGAESDWLDAHDFSLSSFLSHLEKAHQELPVDSHLQSLMAETSVDYVAKFADLAAEVDEQDLSDDLP